MDWQLTCRVCLESGEMVSLFDWDENNEQLCSKYEFCCGAEVSKDDNLPTLICLNCVDRLTFSYQFKQQCLTSNSTLQECLDEFLKTSASANEGSLGKELISIKQENGLLCQYELPIENETTWTRTLSKSANKAVVTKAPGPRKRGRPRKYPHEDGSIEKSPYTRKKIVNKKEPTSITSLLNTNLKEEPADDTADERDDFSGDDNDPEFDPQEEEPATTPRKRGRPRKTAIKKEAKTDDENPADDDMLLKETILALSEPIREDALPKPKPKKPPKKKYVYEKTHICETCGSAFASNASLQAHIRRHLGIKPFVCSLCGYSCVMQVELRRHMVRHTGERAYQCRICDRRFGDFGSRQKHERLHMGVRPYTCSVCGKSFTYSYVLNNHMLTHTGEKKYSCDTCNKKFTKAHHLKYHNKVHHKEVYLKQQQELEEKRKREQIKLTGLSGVVSGQIVDGKLQIIQENLEMDEAQMEVVEQLDGVEEEEDGEYAEKETDRAVAGIAADEMDHDMIFKTEVHIRPD